MIETRCSFIAPNTETALSAENKSIYCMHAAASRIDFVLLMTYDKLTADICFVFIVV